MNGAYEIGFKTGLIKALRKFALKKLTNCIKASSDDIFQNCSFILSIFIQNPEFEGNIVCISFFHSFMKIN